MSTKKQKTTKRAGALAELNKMTARYAERAGAIATEESHLANLRNEIVQTEKRIAGMKEKQLALGLEITRQIGRAGR